VNVWPGVLVATAVRQSAPLEARTKGRFDVREDCLGERQYVSGNLADLKVPALDAAFLFKDLGVHVRPIREIPHEVLIIIVEYRLFYFDTCCCFYGRRYGVVAAVSIGNLVAIHENGHVDRGCGCCHVSDTLVGWSVLVGSLR